MVLLLSLSHLNNTFTCCWSLMAWLPIPSLPRHLFQSHHHQLVLNISTYNPSNLCFPLLFFCAHDWRSLDILTIYWRSLNKLKLLVVLFKHFLRQLWSNIIKPLHSKRSPWVDAGLIWYQTFGQTIAYHQYWGSTGVLTVPDNLSQLVMDQCHFSHTIWTIVCPTFTFKV